MHPVRAQLTRSKLQGVFDYWDARRGTAPFPSRTAIDPLDMRFALGNIVLIDVQREPLRFRFRLVGTSVVEKWGYDMTGRFVDELPDPVRLALVLEKYREVVETGQPLCIRGERNLDGRYWSYESVMMPLGETEQVNMILICVEYVLASAQR
jgi:hypothetical protein